MRHLISLFLLSLLASLQLLAAQEEAVSASQGQEVPSEVSDGSTRSEPQGKTKEETLGAEVAKSKLHLTLLPNKKSGAAPSYLFVLGENLSIRAEGDLEPIREELEKPPASRALTLYFDGVPMAGLPLHVVDGESDDGDVLILRFGLTRNSADNESRSSWDRLLVKEQGYRRSPVTTLAIGAGAAHGVQTDPSFNLVVASPKKIGFTFWFLLAALVAAYWALIANPSILREGPLGSYSLGKSQMAFWGLLVALAFAGVWYLTGSVERIPQQVLILLGISAATGLSAVVIGQSKKAAREEKAAELRKEKQDLQQRQRAAPVDSPPLHVDRLAAIEKELKRLEPPVSPASKGFWRDICDDGNGLSFHRIQVVIWTLLLGAVFIRAVGEVISMPEFSETLLVLMGISSGTYLGFKFPEKE